MDRVLWWTLVTEVSKPSGPSNTVVNVKVKLSPCLTNYALSHENVWGSGCIHPRFLELGTSGGEWSASRPDRFTPGEGASVTHGYEV
jgi:hypothetical protein